MLAIKFLLVEAPIFEKYLRIFQANGSLAHCIFGEMKILLMTVMKRFLKPSVVDGKLTKELIQVDPTDSSNQLALDNIDFGAETMKEVFLFSVYLIRMHECLFIFFKKVFLYLLLYLIFIV